MWRGSVGSSRPSPAGYTLAGLALSRVEGVGCDSQLFNSEISLGDRLIQCSLDLGTVGNSHSLNLSLPMVYSSLLLQIRKESHVSRIWL